MDINECVDYDINQCVDYVKISGETGQQIYQAPIPACLTF